MRPASRLILSLFIAVALVGCSGPAREQANGSREGDSQPVAGSVPKVAKPVPLNRSPSKSPQEPKPTARTEQPERIASGQNGEKVVESQSSHGPIKVTIKPLVKDPKPITPSAAPPKTKTGSDDE